MCKVSAVKFAISLIMLLLAWPYQAMGDVLTLEAAPGQLYFLEAEEISETGEVSFSITVDETRSHETWVPTVYMGLVDKDTGNLFSLGVSQLGEESTLSAVYSVYQDGEFVRGKRLVKGIPMGVEVPFTLKWDRHGNIEFTVLSDGKYQEKLPFLNPMERFAASGAIATMDITHNNAAQPDAAKPRGWP